EVPQQHVGLRGDVARLGGHLLVGEVKEMDHPLRLDGDLARRLRRIDRQRLEELFGVSQCLPFSVETAAQPSYSVISWRWGRRSVRRGQARRASSWQCMSGSSR